MTDMSMLDGEPTEDSEDLDEDVGAPLTGDDGWTPMGVPDHPVWQGVRQ